MQALLRHMYITQLTSHFSELKIGTASVAKFLLDYILQTKDFQVRNFLVFKTVNSIHENDFCYFFFFNFCSLLYFHLTFLSPRSYPRRGIYSVKESREFNEFSANFLVKQNFL